MSERKLNPDDVAILPAHEFPFWVRNYAIQNNTNKNILLIVKGGLGDQICSEPAIRFLRHLMPQPDLKWSLYCDFPEVFEHLEFIDKVFINNKDEVNKLDYHYIELNYYLRQAAGSFMTPICYNSVNYSAVSATRCEPLQQFKEIKLSNWADTDFLRQAKKNPYSTIVIHPGSHWPTKTFPKEWWRDLIGGFAQAGFNVCLVGKKDGKGLHGKTGYVDLDFDYSEEIPGPAPYKKISACAGSLIDLRDKLCLFEFLQLSKDAKYIFSNDSAIIHAAAAGDGFIGFVANPKHGDYLKHYRKGIKGLDTKNFGRKGFWDAKPITPFEMNTISVENMPDGLSYSDVLPPVEEIISFYVNLYMKKSYFNLTCLKNKIIDEQSYFLQTDDGEKLIKIKRF